jgi:hypothetical protein
MKHSSLYHQDKQLCLELVLFKAKLWQEDLFDCALA